MINHFKDVAPVRGNLTFRPYSPARKSLTLLFFSLRVVSVCCWLAFLLLSSGCTRVVEMRDNNKTTSVKVKPISGSQKPRAPNVAAQNPSIEQMENTVRARINGERRKHGLQPLEGNHTLDRIAREYSRRMSRERFFSHYDAQGKSAADRVRAAGVAYSVVGENLFLSANAPNPINGSVKGWMKSKDHRINILTENYTQTGVGIWKRGRTYLFTQIFIRPL